MTNRPRLAAGVFVATMGLLGSSVFGKQPVPVQPVGPPAVPIAPVPPAYPVAPAATAPGVPATVGTGVLTEEQQIGLLARTLQDRIELDARLSGALVLGGELVPRDEGGRSLVLRGKFLAEDQIQLLTDLIPTVLDADPYWSTVRDEVFVDLRGMPIIAPSGIFAARYYGLGLDFFRRGDYVAADRAFARAISEAPAVEAYRWWSVLAAIAQGQSSRAEAKLRPLLRVNPFGSQSPAIATELTRIQGPLRWQLQALEKVVLLNDVLGAPAYDEIPSASPPPAGPPPAPPQEVRRPSEPATKVAAR